jgi:PAS domain S-box-containing protein
MNTKLSILLVEDEPIDRLAFERYVKKNGIDCHYRQAGSVREATEILNTESFDALIFDYMLGDGTAIDLFHLAGDTPIIVVTGLGDEMIAVAAMKAGAADYLIKDTQGGYLNTIFMVIERAIQNKRNEIEIDAYRNNLEQMVSERTSALAAEMVQHQKAERALQESKRNWERTFNAITDMIIIISVKRVIVTANEAAAKVLNCSLNELVGQSYHDIFGSNIDDPTLCPLECLFNQQQGLTVEFQFNKEQTHLVSCSPVYDANGAIMEIVLVGKNITEQKKLENQLVHAQKMEAIGVLASGISHDFNNILTGILGYSQLAINKAEPKSFIYKALDCINSAGLRGRDLVRQILAFSRTSPESKELIQIQPIILEALRLLRASLPSNIAIQQDIDPECGFIMANPIQIHQVLMNLCTNASHAMEETGGILRISLKMTTLSDAQMADLHLPSGRYLVISVEDSGSGIAPETVHRIFEPFFSTKGVGKGTGMGLSVVHGIITQSGGAITVESTQGKGTTFLVFLPLFKAKTAEPIPEPESSPLPTGTGRILFVDDEEQIRSFSKTMLEILGYEVILAADGLEALEIFTANANDIDLVITDKTMPGINGLVLASKIREVRPDTPIILCSGDQACNVPGMLDKSCVDKLMTKPFVIKDLASIVQEAMTQRSAP